MASNGGAITKLQDKAKRNAMAKRMGTIKPILTRTKTPFADKAMAFAEHKRAIHGHMVNGVMVDEGGRNPPPAMTFWGDGLPDEVIPGSKNWSHVKAAKTNAERAAADKRNPIKSEVRDGWKPQSYSIKPNRSERRAAIRASIAAV
jgi:hypothetical protein